MLQSCLGGPSAKYRAWTCQHTQASLDGFLAEAWKQVSPGVCWSSLEIGEFPRSSPRLLYSIYLRSTLYVGGRSITCTSLEVLPAPSGECSPPLEMCEFPRSSPRFLQGSYPRSSVDVRGSSIPMSSPWPFAGTSRSTFVFSGHKWIPR